MQIQRRTAKWYLLVHVAFLAAVFLFPVYRTLAEKISGIFTGCIVHDRLFLYCPLCGGTRAVAALLRLDLASAWNYNAFVTLAAIAAVILDLVALIRLLRGKKRLLPLPACFWIILVVVMVLYAVLRNYLMIAHGYDPAGDLLFFWRAVL